MLGLWACEKSSDDATPPVVKEPNYFPLTTGSYWVYNTYRIDSLGNEELLRENDTTTVIGDTLINGNTFKIFYGSLYGSSIKREQYYRDSSDYIVSPYGTIVFSSVNFTDTLYSGFDPDTDDPMIFKYTKMENYNSLVTIPAGEFDSILNCPITVHFLKNQNNLIGKNDYLYAPNVGRILHQYFYISQYEMRKEYQERRLVDYYIAK